MNAGLATIVFGGLGYVLIYAAIANHGRFATHPWLGLLADAYTGETSTATPAPSSSSSSSPSSSGSSSGSVRPGAVVRSGGRTPRNRLVTA